MKLPSLPIVVALLSTFTHAAVLHPIVNPNAPEDAEAAFEVSPRNEVQDIEPPITSLADFEGKRLKGSTGSQVYLVLDNKLSLIADGAVYEGLFGTRDIKYDLIPQPLIDVYPKGPVIDSRTPLVKGADAPTYLIHEAKKRWFPTGSAFDKYGFSWAKIVNIGGIVDLIPSGPNIS